MFQKCFAYREMEGFSSAFFKKSECLKYFLKRDAPALNYCYGLGKVLSLASAEGLGKVSLASAEGIMSNLEVILPRVELSYEMKYNILSS